MPLDLPTLVKVTGMIEAIHHPRMFTLIHLVPSNNHTVISTHDHDTMVGTIHDKLPILGMRLRLRPLLVFDPWRL